MDCLLLFAVCPAPPPLTGSGAGLVLPVKTEYEVNDEVTYSCTGTLNVRGVNKNKCKADGTWEYTTGPSCEAVCYAAPTIANGDYTPKNTYTTAPGTVTYTCTPGSVPTTPQTATCLAASLTWDPLPVCRKSCAAPPAVTNAGTGVATMWAQGDMITYMCAPTTSYKTVAATSGNNALNQNECLATGLWRYTAATDLPTCVAICSTAPVTATGTTTIVPAAGPYDLNANAVYTCTAPTPSNPLGPTTLTCTGPNTWTPAAAPTCVSGCVSVPQIAANGNQIPGTQWTPNQVVTYSCTSAAYALTTPTMNTCTAATLAWTSATAPSCLQKCTTALPSAPTNGNNVLDATKDPVPGENVEGTRYTYTCAATYALAIGSSTENTCTGGAWPNAAPSCVPACTNPPAGTVGSPTPSPNNALNPQGTSVTYACATGTTLVGTATIACQATRVWLPATAPECITNCAAPPAIPSNGAPNTPAAGPYTIGSSITYACAANFRLVGSASNMCQRVGTATAGSWSAATAPTCVPSDKDLDIVMILDGNDPLDGCSTKSPAVTPPVLPGSLLMPVPFPNFFLQQTLAAAIESGWGTVAQANTRIGYHMHAGVCTLATNQNQLPIKLLMSTASTINLFTNLGYACATPNNPIKAIQCADAYHFTATHGDRSTIPNVVILVMHNTQSYTAAERATFLTEINAIRASLKGTLMIVSILPSVDTNYAANEAYIRMLLTCPASGICLNFLGSAATSSTVLSKLRLAAAALP
ncbi:CUB and sushi domain-containing protein 3 [Ciona intestinalis]